MHGALPRRVVRPTLLIVGCGDVGLRVLRLLHKRWRVLALTSSPDRTTELRVAGALPLAGNLDQPSTLARLAGLADAVLHLAPPPARGARDTRTANLLHALMRKDRVRRFVYASTSGVYGDCGGARFDETRPLQPTTERAMRRVDAEARVRWYGRHTGVRCSVLRIPGIYGPGRLSTDRIRTGMPVIEEKEANPGNRIHVDDLATCCIAALSPDVPDGIYNVGDGNHRSGTWFTSEVARQVGLPPPPTISLAEAQKTFSPMRLSFLRESRIIDTTKMREVLGVLPKYADAADGIAAALAEEANQ